MGGWDGGAYRNQRKRRQGLAGQADLVWRGMRKVLARPTDVVAKTGLSLHPSGVDARGFDLSADGGEVRFRDRSVAWVSRGTGDGWKKDRVRSGGEVDENGDGGRTGRRRSALEGGGQSSCWVSRKTVNGTLLTGLSGRRHTSKGDGQQSSGTKLTTRPLPLLVGYSPNTSSPASSLGSLFPAFLLFLLSLPWSMSTSIVDGCWSHWPARR